VSVVSLTGHKTQGTTMDALIVAPPGDKYRYGQSGWLYVVMSRVKSLNGLFLTEPLCEDPQKYVPRHNILKELNRLRQELGKTTAEKLDRIIQAAETKVAPLPSTGIAYRPQITGNGLAVIRHVLKLTRKICDALPDVSSRRW
jgi:hypothetical protein